MLICGSTGVENESRSECRLLLLNAMNSVEGGEGRRKRERGSGREQEYREGVKGVLDRV